MMIIQILTKDDEKPHHLKTLHAIVIESISWWQQEKSESRKQNVASGLFSERNRDYENAFL